MPQLLMKPWAWFKPDPNQPRKTFDEAALTALGASMKAVGQLGPVGAKADGTLLWGERRYRAAELAGIKELSVIITEKPLSDSEIRVVQLSENLHRSSLSDPEVYLGVKELATLNPTWLNKDLAARLSKDASWVTRLLAIDDLIPPAREAFLAGAFGFSIAYEISKAPEQEQAELLAVRLSGASRDEVGRQSRKRRNGAPTARVNRITCPLVSGIVIAVSGAQIGLDDVLRAISEFQKEVKRANEQGLDAKTFERVCRDKAKAR